MNIEEIEELVDNYRHWLKDKTSLRQVGDDWVEITTPYLDNHNDCLQIYARKENGGFVLTDDGYVIDDLLNSGCPLDSPRRRELLRMTLAAFGVQNDAEQLSIHATRDNFSFKKHNLIQAMLAVGDLFYLASPQTMNLFHEDLKRWLDLSEIRYTPNVKLAGKSGFDHIFNFVIPKSSREPERIIQALSNPKKDSAETLVFKWLDTREIRRPDSRLIAFLNDGGDKISQPVIDALTNYELSPVKWSQREEAREYLAA